jgi:hypothetical protein
MADAAADAITLASGCCVQQPVERLRRFFTEEYDYYDAIVDGNPVRVLPLDVIVTAAVNARIGQAAQLRRIHRGLAERTDPLLPDIPADADILDFDPALAARLVHEAVQVDGVGIAVATKVLHRKRPHLLPMFDSVLVKHYLDLPRDRELPLALYDKRRAGDFAQQLVEAARRDVVEAQYELDALREVLAHDGFHVGRVRILDALLWTEYEAQGYYRDPAE